MNIEGINPYHNNRLYLASVESSHAFLKRTRTVIAFGKEHVYCSEKV